MPHRRVQGEALAEAKKGALAEGRTMMLVDRSGFYLLPTVVRAYAAVGQTPISSTRSSRAITSRS